VDARAAVVEVRDGRVQRMLVRLLQRVEVAHGVAALHRAGRGDGAGLVQQRLGQRGLSTARMPDQRERADLLRRDASHGLLPWAICRNGFERSIDQLISALRRQ
jgi:hypothetical protein